MFLTCVKCEKFDFWEPQKSIGSERIFKFFFVRTLFYFLEMEIILQNKVQDPKNFLRSRSNNFHFWLEKWKLKCKNINIKSLNKYFIRSIEFKLSAWTFLEYNANLILFLNYVKYKINWFLTSRKSIEIESIFNFFWSKLILFSKNENDFIKQSPRPKNFFEKSFKWFSFLIGKMKIKLSK